ncbi:MAG: uroporphyrinogen decarboxylase family protein [Bacteroidales bacterium]
MEQHVIFHPILMHFAARYAGFSYGAFASDHRVLVESNLRCQEEFSLDAVGLISDPYRETAAFGARVTFPEEAVPRCHRSIIEKVEDIRALRNPDVHRAERTRDRILAGKALRKRIGSSIPVIGWIEGPLAECCNLAGVNEVLLRLYMDPGFVQLLIEKVMVTAKDFARAQVEAGCEIIGVGDAICSQISAEDYRAFVKESHRELFDYIHSLGAKVKLHICGNITHLLEELPYSRPDIVDLDWMVDMERAHSLLGTGIVRCGNLDPVALIQDKDREAISRATRLLCEKEKGRGFILSGGCEITVQTPPGHLKAMRESSVHA